MHIWMSQITHETLFSCYIVMTQFKCKLLNELYEHKQIKKNQVRKWFDIIKRIILKKSRAHTLIFK